MPRAESISLATVVALLTTEDWDDAADRYPRLLAGWTPGRYATERWRVADLADAEEAELAALAEGLGDWEDSPAARQADRIDAALGYAAGW